MEKQPKGPFCQSCGMPLNKPEDFGTDKLGWKINDFCQFCFQNGKFTDPEMTKDQMVDNVIKLMVNQLKISECNKANSLKRWN